MSSISSANKTKLTFADKKKTNASTAMINMQVLKGYLLQKLFGPGVADVTSDQNILYLDLPSNMKVN